MEKDLNKKVAELEVEELDFTEVEEIEEVATPVFVGTSGCCS
ncbi:hypothetical protein [Clostridium yunnanense]|nr:hypothetical protein [Clostridium yunnanense]